VSEGDIYVADSGNHCIRRISSDGIVSTLAGSGKKGFRNGVGTEAQFNNPWDIKIIPDENLVVGDFENFAIRKVTKTGRVTTLAGTGVKGFKDGPATEAILARPTGICVGSDGTIYFTDVCRVRKIFKRIWSVSTHHLFPNQVQDEVKTLFLVSRHGHLRTVPRDILFLFSIFIATDRVTNPDTGNHLSQTKRRKLQ